MHQPIAYLPARVGIQMLSAEKCSTCWFLHSSIDNEQVARTANMCDNTHTTSDYHPKHDSSIFCHVSCCVHIQTFLYTKCSKTWCFCRLIVKNQTFCSYGHETCRSFIYLSHDCTVFAGSLFAASNRGSMYDVFLLTFVFRNHT